MQCRCHAAPDFGQHGGRPEGRIWCTSILIGPRRPGPVKLTPHCAGHGPSPLCSIVSQKSGRGCPERFLVGAVQSPPLGLLVFLFAFFIHSGSAGRQQLNGYAMHTVGGADQNGPSVALPARQKPRRSHRVAASCQDSEAAVRQQTARSQLAIHQSQSKAGNRRRRIL